MDFPATHLESSISIQEATKPVEEPMISQFPAALDFSAPMVEPKTLADVPEEEVKGRLGSVSSTITPPPLTTAHQLTPASPSLVTPALNAGDLLEFSKKQPDSRPSTPRAPQIVINSIDSPNGPDILPFPGRRSPKVDVAHLRLPSNIPRDPGLPQILRQESSESQFTGGVSLSGPQDFTSPDPSSISTGARNLGTPGAIIYGDPKDEDPSLSSFGDGELQGIPVAQVGLRSPMFTSSSKAQGFLRANNAPSQRFPSPDNDIDGVTPGVEENRKLELAPSPSIEAEPRAEEVDKGKGGKEGEEGWNSLSWIARQFKS